MEYEDESFAPYELAVTVVMCDEYGDCYQDFGYLLEMGSFATREDAMRCYFAVGLSSSQEAMMARYLRKWIEPDEGLYLYYEVFDRFGNQTAGEQTSLC